MTSPRQVVRCVIVVLHHAQADGTASQRAGPAAGDADSTDEHQGRAKDVVGCGKTEVRWGLNLEPKDYKGKRLSTTPSSHFEP